VQVLEREKPHPWPVLEELMEVADTAPAQGYEVHPTEVARMEMAWKKHRASLHLTPGCAPDTPPAAPLVSRKAPQ